MKENNTPIAKPINKLCFIFSIKRPLAMYANNEEKTIIGEYLRNESPSKNNPMKTQYAKNNPYVNILSLNILFKIKNMHMIEVKRNIKEIKNHKKLSYLKKNNNPYG